ncbi:MAG: putative lipid II flippase FtsW [Candidatus Spechtbacterales bacterium]|nr:putative lipid II flippase FtsW [Candidatus Spechtbacterales bacterium]
MARKKKKPDKILLYAFGALIFIGIVALISASAQQSNKDFGNIYEYFVHQFLYGFIIGGIAAFIMYKLPYKKLKKLAPIIFAISLGLMLLVFVPGLALETGGAQRWINLRFATFQPSELVKLAFVIYLAAWLSNKMKEMKKGKEFFPFMVLLSILILLLMAQPDFSTTGIIAITAGAMYFAAGARLKYIGGIMGAGIAAFYIFVKTSPYRMSRVLTFLNPESDPFGMGYQINQLMIAVGSGKLFGLGPLQGIQKNLLPLAMNDSIYAVWAEELGFIGASLLVLIFLIIVWRGFKIAELAGNDFARLTALGITVWLFIQAIVNMGAILGILPLTGVTLPLISYGSSSMIVTLMAAGLLLQLSKEIS